MLKNDQAQKNGTSPIGLFGSAPPPDLLNGKSKNTGKDFGSDGLFEEQNKKGQFLKIFQAQVK